MLVHFFKAGIMQRKQFDLQTQKNDYTYPTIVTIAQCYIST